MDTIDMRTPTPDQYAAAADQRVLFGHQSVGANMIDGLREIYADSGSTLTIAEAGSIDGSSFPAFAHAYVGSNGDPLGKLDAFEDLVTRTADSIDVALVKFCYVDITAETDVDALFEAYSSSLHRLAEAHPNVRFIAATVPLTTDRSWKATLKAFVGIDDQAGPADNVTRQRYNDLVRTEFGGRGELFDIAAVEATLDTKPAVRSDADQHYAVLNRALASDNGHLNGLGSRLVAAELVRVLASR